MPHLTDLEGVHLQLEVKNAGEQIVEDLAKIGTTTQEVRSFM